MRSDKLTERSHIVVVLLESPSQEWDIRRSLSPLDLRVSKVADPGFLFCVLAVLLGKLDLVLEVLLGLVRLADLLADLLVFFLAVGEVDRVFSDLGHRRLLLGRTREHLDSRQVTPPSLLDAH